MNTVIFHFNPKAVPLPNDSSGLSYKVQLIDGEVLQTEMLSDSTVVFKSKVKSEIMICATVVSSNGEELGVFQSDGTKYVNEGDEILLNGLIVLAWINL